MVLRVNKRKRGVSFRVGRADKRTRGRAERHETNGAKKTTTTICSGDDKKAREGYGYLPC